MTRKISIIGAAVGLAGFLAVGLLPSILYGGYAGVMLASGIYGSPLQPTTGVKALIVFGMVMGALGVSALFTVAGATGGAVVGTLLSNNNAVASRVTK